MSIRWIRNVHVDGQPATLEILLGDIEISDKCYAKISNGPEHWFRPAGESRGEVLGQGIELLKSKLEGKKVTYPGGATFDWKK